ncbi:MAG: hypothetical protein R3F19_05725 [Verrucomicrobiales bacterium]
MTFALLAPKNLAGASDFESLGHGLLGFGLSGCSCHRFRDNSGEITIGNNDFHGLFRPQSKRSLKWSRQVRGVDNEDVQILQEMAEIASFKTP